AYDAKRVASELHADRKHNGFQRFTIRLTMNRTTARLPEHAAAVKEAIDKDPAYARMFAIAASTRTEWEGLWRSEAELVDLALAMDDSRVTSSRRAFDGCDDKAWPAFRSAVSRIPARQFGGIDTDPLTWKRSPHAQVLETIAADPRGYLA